MNYRGRQIDPVQFWGRYVSWPNGIRIDEADVFSPKVPCPNPQHDTLKSHFQVNLSQPTVHCFAHCGISGSYEHAICVIEGLYEKFKVEEAPNEREAKRRRNRAYREAKKIILRNARSGQNFQRRPHVQGSRKSVTSVPANELQYESYLPQAALEYLSDRGVTENSIAAWQLGWLPEEKRIAIPARDENNRVKFLIKRAILKSQSPKYLYTEGFPKTSLLFGACALDLGLVKSEGLILVEGSFDAIHIHQIGLPIAVGILGTGISEQQRRIIAHIRPPKIFHFFDKDSAGVHNIEIAVPMLRKYPQFVMRYPRNRFDPAEMEEEEIYRSLIRAVPALKFLQENGLNVRPKRKEIQVGYH